MTGAAFLFMCTLFEGFVGGRVHAAPQVLPSKKARLPALVLLCNASILNFPPSLPMGVLDASIFITSIAISITWMKERAGSSVAEHPCYRITLCRRIEVRSPAGPEISFSPVSFSPFGGAGGVENYQEPYHDVLA